jgi:hypothetical protein
MLPDPVFRILKRKLVRLLLRELLAAFGILQVQSSVVVYVRARPGEQLDIPGPEYR